MHRDAQDPFDVTKFFNLKVSLEVVDGIFDQRIGSSRDEEVVHVDSDYNCCPLPVSFDEAAGVGQ